MLQTDIWNVQNDPCKHVTHHVIICQLCDSLAGHVVCTYIIPSLNMAMLRQNANSAHLCVLVYKLPHGHVYTCTCTYMHVLTLYIHVYAGTIQKRL